MLSHVSQNIENTGFVLNKSNYYQFSSILPKEIFIKGYPSNPQNTWKLIRKARMDAGMQIKDLAALVGMTEDN
jgi:hypothetical protein